MGSRKIEVEEYNLEEMPKEFNDVDVCGILISDEKAGPKFIPLSSEISHAGIIVNKKITLIQIPSPLSVGGIIDKWGGSDE